MRWSIAPTVRIFRLRKEDNVDFWEVWGNVRIAHGERIWARNIGLKSIDSLLLTPEGGSVDAYFATKWVWYPKRPSNYASIHIFDHDGSAHSGSVDVNFYAIGL
jgi:hypothetical protein